MRRPPRLPPGPISRETSAAVSEYLDYLSRALRINTVSPLNHNDSDAGVNLWLDQTSFGTTAKARWIRFHLAGTLLTTDASQGSCPVDEFFQGPDPGATVTVFNIPAKTNNTFSGKVNYKGLAVYDDVADTYWIVELKHQTPWIRFSLAGTLAITDMS